MTSPKRRVLLVSSAYPPTMLADMQRVRLLAEELPALGWEVEVLTPGSSYQRDLWIEPDAVVLRPPTVKVHEPELHCDRFFKALGMRSVGWRALLPMYSLGGMLIKNGKFDIVYVSTTQFVLFCLGPLWFGQFGIPYILDFHDPWYAESKGYETSRSRVKRKVSNWLAKTLERVCVESAAGIVSVSPNYLESFNRRYPELKANRPIREEVIPFAAAKGDLASTATRPRSPVEGSTETFRIIYVGAGGAIMSKSFTYFLECLASIKDTSPNLLEGVKVQLFGTYAYWQEGEPRPLQELADGMGISDLVEEKPARITYMHAMKLVKEADGLIVLGVDDPAYMPSKLFTYALSGRPLLACFHRNSQALGYFGRFPSLGHFIGFDHGGECADEDLRSVTRFLTEVRERRTLDRADGLADFLPRAMAVRHIHLFEQCVNG